MWHISEKHPGKPKYSLTRMKPKEIETFSDADFDKNVNLALAILCET